jgi:hypothetical protein
MADLTTPASHSGSVQDHPFALKAAVVLALAALADWLLYDQRIGIFAVFFAIALACGALLANFARLDRGQAMLAGILVVASLVPAVEDFNAASLFFMALALGIGLSLTTNSNLASIGEHATALCDLYLIGPFRLLRDATGVFGLAALTTGFTVWFIPLVLGSVFAFLFASANPLIAKWIMLIGPGDASSYVSIVRVGAATILRSLILFNLLFAVQSVLDMTYLWGNATLPADVSYAAYAHRGGYPLILTALLAAGFVLAAMNPGGPAERSKVIRPLSICGWRRTCCWVASSILRLDLYVQIYLLTWWRVAAFIWMLLVAFGLLLVVARIALNRPNEWLIRANLMTLTATLYLCSLVNFAAVIAGYNVGHSREVSGKGVQLDMNYLVHLGPQALPAIDRAIQVRGADPTLVSRRNCLVEQQRNDLASWRAWSFRSWRLQRTLDAQRQTSAAS